MNKQPLLSICIPTRNRADVLVKCLDSIVNNPAFNEDVEVVVSDNCSEDNTQELVRSYTDRFENVKYFRNDSNIGVCRNLEHVLDVAQGVFLKLNNDYSVFNEGSLQFLLDTVKANLVDKPVLYFHNKDSDIKYKKIEDFNIYFKEAMWMASWIGSYGYWKDDFKEYDDRCRRETRLFVIVDWFIREYKKRKKILCCYKYLTANGAFSSKKGGYNVFEVHTRNFIEQYEELVPLKILDESTIEYVKRKSLFPGMISWYLRMRYFNRKGKFTFDSNNALEIIKREFGYYPWYRKELVKNIVYSICACIKNEYIKPLINRILMKKQN